MPPTDVLTDVVTGGEGGLLIEMLEKGGLPALVCTILFIITFFFIRSNAKAQTKRDEKEAEARKVREKAQADAFIALQKERLTARKREAEQYNELMQAYEDLIEKFVDQSIESTKAITRLSERISQHLLRGPALVVGEPEGSDGD
jgi:hypothetical protein